MTQAPPDVAALRSALVGSAALCPLEWTADRSAVVFAKLSEAKQREASFLDRRAIQPDTPTGSIPWSLAEPWLVERPRACDFIFHVSHCGSTLISRLLGSDPAVLPLREPGILRGLRDADSASRFAATVGLLSRTFQADQRPLIKATSVVNAVAWRLMEETADARGILIGLPAETFLAAVLDGSRSDIEAHAEARRLRLVEAGRLTPATSIASPGEQAAAAWACEMVTLRSLADRAANRVLWIDFDRFLEAPAASLQAAFAFLGREVDVEAVVSGPLMHRYAKKTDVAYDAAFRSRLLATAQQRFQPEIAAGMNWLDRHGCNDLSAC